MDSKQNRIDTQGINLEGFLEKLNKKFNIEKIILFGSRARGENLKSSDVDLLIISPDFKGVDFRERIIKVSELWDEEYRIEPICLTPKEYQRRKNEPSIVGRASKEGKNLKVKA